jgi:DNA polymerase-3 subunit gamma/tau
VSFYQKYRPKKISELDLVSVRESLGSTLKSGKVSHAYLFMGPRGSGKTSAARILAQVVNCEKNQDKKDNLGEPCGKCPSCVSLTNGSSVDVIEIDAASSGLVDDIRDLREKVRLAPVQLPKKVYIIDEVHMVSTAGFNALLKTLEEPPKHAIFILCTTEAQKVPETIMSRCARINFTKASNKEIISSLMKAVKGEGIDIDEDALREIAEATDGSFREGHKLLEQVASYGKTIDAGLVLEVLGIVSRVSIKKLLEAAKNHEAAKIVKIFGELEKGGIKAQVLAGSLIFEVKHMLEEGLERGIPVSDELKLIDELIEATDKVKVSPLPLLPLEIALLTLAIDDSGGGTNVPKVEAPAQQQEKDDVLNTHKVESAIQEDNLDNKSNVVVQNYDGPLVSIDRIKTEWMDFLNVMSGSCGSLAGMLRLVSPVDIKGKSITLSVNSRFQQDMLERDVKKKLIEEQMAKIWGPVTFRCVLGDKGPDRVEPEQSDVNIESVSSEEPVEKSILAAAEKIFGE